MKKTPLYPIHERLGATFTTAHLEWHIAATFTGAIAEHHAVRTKVGVTDVSYRGRLRLTGDDRARFLHRLISNDVESLAVGEGTYATLLTNRGKIIADMEIAVFADTIWIDTAPETTETLFKELDRYIIADDVEFTDVTADTGAIAVHGPEATALVGVLLGTDTLATLPLRGNLFSAEQGIWCVRSETTGETGYTLYTDAAGLAPLWEKLLADGNGVTAVPIGWTALESLRIEAGVPRYGAELTDNVIPLEAELEHAIDFEKGCYIGQEIVARMKYRGHPNRLLRGITIDDSQDRVVPPGARLFAGEKDIGWLTSTTFAPTLGQSVALGYVRMAQSEPGSAVEIETEDGRVAGTVAVLPFVKTDADAGA